MSNDPVPCGSRRAQLLDPHLAILDRHRQRLECMVDDLRPRRRRAHRIARAAASVVAFAAAFLGAVHGGR